jgi:hypothetical protein
VTIGSNGTPRHSPSGSPVNSPAHSRKGSDQSRGSRASGVSKSPTRANGKSILKNAALDSIGNGLNHKVRKGSVARSTLKLRKAAMGSIAANRTKNMKRSTMINANDLFIGSMPQ